MTLHNTIPDLVLGGNFTVPQYSMISGQGEYQSKEWLKIEAKRGIWLVLPNREASQIIFWRDTKGTSQGFGGSTLKFKIIGELFKPTPENIAQELSQAINPPEWEERLFDEPETLELQGPWGSNTESLFQDTGYDIRDRIKSWGCIGRGRSWDKGNNPNATSRTIIEDLVYFDTEPQHGKYDRIQKLAEQLSNERQETLFYYQETFGGSSSGPVNFGKFKTKEEFAEALTQMNERN